MRVNLIHSVIFLVCVLHRSIFKMDIEKPGLRLNETGKDTLPDEQEMNQ